MHLVKKDCTLNKIADASVNRSVSFDNPLKKTIMVVEDNAINRRIIIKMLGLQYNIIEAANGLEALKLFKENFEQISLVLLDIIMPVMDGFDFLTEVKTYDSLAPVPIIVMTTSNDMHDEIRCLELGASDYITKPLNPEIVKHRIAGIIKLKESVSMVDLLKYDNLTGAYNKEYFYKNVEKELILNPDEKFDIVCCDVVNFKLINEKYGSFKSDELLKHIYSILAQSSNIRLFGRIGSDSFAALVVRCENYSQKDFESLAKLFYENSPVKFIMKFGIYEIIDKSIHACLMCDRAMLALNTTKKVYGVYYSKYDDKLRLGMIREQQIVDDMESALNRNEFKVYLQPKHGTESEKISGAEALVRWIHPKYGLISPDDFVPVFEKNGFITKLDEFMVKRVCEILNGWKKSGIELLPISVNLSRVDFNKPDLAKKIITVVDEHNVEHKYIYFEVTESAYTANPEKIIEVVNELRKSDFKIEMDDFGTGYSSLNMLNELPIDVLKIDMSFLLRNKKSEGKRKTILEFIINLAKWMNIPSLAEGVETKEEVDELKRMGCDYIQGCYYSEPMPESDFKNYLKLLT